jgi:hypothetical protein
VYSPDKAPKNDPPISPIGPAKKSPINKPTVAPIKPFLVPPNFFKPIIGIRRSIINIDTATKNVIRRNCILNGTILEKWITSNPTQLVIGPGIIGLKLPIIPKIQKIKPTIIKKISIEIFFLKLYLILEL